MPPPAPPETSVIVVSRGRPAGLRRALLSLARQDHPAMELVVVADAAGLTAIAGLPFRPLIRTRRFDDANISHARNIGIAAAAGEVVAFIDDDAVALRGWAQALTLPFRDASVCAATGPVRDRHGVALSWQPVTLDRRAQEAPLPLPAQTSLHAGHRDRATVTIGTNAAFRRETLCRLGGFDPAYRYFLDEADLNMRIATAGGVTAISPAAQVIHGLAASPVRRADRAPRDLFQIGASTAAFLCRHCPVSEREAAQDAARATQRARLLRHMVAGRLEPRDVARLLKSFDAGFADGAARPLSAPSEIRPATAPFVPLPPATEPPLRLAANLLPGPRLRRQAETLAATGADVTVACPAPWPLRSSLRFSDTGVWWLRGRNG